MEDLLEDDVEFEEGTSIDDEKIWLEILENNYAELFTSFNITGEEKEIMKGLVAASMQAERKEHENLKRPKRQAGFPGSTRKNRPNRY